MQGQPDGDVAVVEENVVQSSRPQTLNANTNGDLDDMMGDLQSDMNKQGVVVMPKGHCAACMKPIVGQVSYYNYQLTLN